MSLNFKKSLVEKIIHQEDLISGKQKNDLIKKLADTAHQHGFLILFRVQPVQVMQSLFLQQLQEF